jgi:hypothetical protein
MVGHSERRIQFEGVLKKVLLRTFVPKKWGGMSIGGWKILHVEEIHNFRPHEINISVINWKRMVLSGCAARIREIIQILVTGSLWCRQLQQSFQYVNSPLFFSSLSLHVLDPTGHPQERYTIGCFNGLPSNATETCSEREEKNKGELTYWKLCCDWRHHKEPVR